MTCTACPDEERICRETFTCSECGRRRNVCQYRVGDSDVCSECWERHELGPEWVKFWASRTKGTHGVSRHDLKRLVRKVEAWRGEQATDESDPDLLLEQMRMLLAKGRAAKLRTACGLSLQDVAQIVGVTKNAVHKWERRAAKPDGEHAIRYARLLDDLLSGRVASE